MRSNRNIHGRSSYRRGRSSKSDVLNENDSTGHRSIVTDGTEKHRRSRRARRNEMPVWIIAVVSIVALTLILFGFSGLSLPGSHAQNVMELASQTSLISPVITPAPTILVSPSPTPVPTITTTPQPTPKTAWGAKFADKFTDGQVVKTDNSYKSENINVTVNKVQKDGMTYYVADIYLTDLKYFKTAFANNKFDSGNRQSTPTIAKNNNAVIAINGDFCTYNKGPVLRNGTLYRDKNYKDALAMYNDGSMETFTKDTFNMETAQSKGAYQIWTFGPMLLDNGQPMTVFNSSLDKLNPRTAIGYYEPGHYCFIVVDGRQKGYSIGITFTDLSQLFYNLGCKAAFNLDGGQTSEMAFMGNLVNKPYKGGRSVSDILYIADQ